jgi:hypothetical protein
MSILVQQRHVMERRIPVALLRIDLPPVIAGNERKTGRSKQGKKGNDYSQHVAPPY